VLWRMREKVALRYKPESRGFDSPWGYWDFLLNSSSHTVALGLIEPLTEMSARDIRWGVKVVVA